MFRGLAYEEIRGVLDVYENILGRKVEYLVQEYQVQHNL